jgi:uncharacterized protein YgiM (DUF1202 family)
MRKYFFLIFIFTYLLPKIAWGADLFVQSHTAPMFKTPSLAGEKIVVLSQGSKVTALKKQGMWQQVQIDKKTGWVYSLMLSTAPPQPPLDITSDQMDQMAQTARKRPSAYASTAAARGLVNQRKRLGQKLSYDYTALSKMESFAAGEKETLQFIKER